MVIAMRTYLSLFFASMASLTVARELFVVVYTTDAMVVEYYCGEPEPTQGVQERLPVRVQIAHGGFQWHAVGGLAPYTAIRTERSGVGTYCVTVIDAAGNVATGCGVVQTFTQRKLVSCRTWQDSIPGQGVTMLVPKVSENGTSDPRVTSGRTVVPERPVQQPRERPVTRHGGMERGGDRPGGTVVRASSEKPAPGGGGRPAGGSSTRSAGSAVQSAPSRVR
jgi:hypothetical protein